MYTGAPTGTGRMAAAAVANVSQSLFRAMNPPTNKGYRVNGHVAITGPIVVDVNFGRRAAQVLSSRRLAEVQPFLDSGMSRAELSAMMYKVRGDVPLGTDLYAAATFVAAGGRSRRLPDNARAWYTAILKDIPDEHLATAIRLLEDTTDAGCVPLAILKERAGRGEAIVGKLGFRHPAHGRVDDWEFGGDGVQWH